MLLQIVNEKLGTVGLKDSGTQGVDEITVMRIGVDNGLIVLVSAAEGIPKAVDPYTALALQERMRLLHIPVVIAVAEFESTRSRLEVLLHECYGGRVVHIHDRAYR